MLAARIRIDDVQVDFRNGQNGFWVYFFDDHIFSEAAISPRLLPPTRPSFHNGFVPGDSREDRESLFIIAQFRKFSVVMGGAAQLGCKAHPL
jgi:hypothetical protein